MTVGILDLVQVYGNYAQPNINRPIKLNLGTVSHNHSICTIVEFTLEEAWNVGTYLLSRVDEERENLDKG